MPTDNLQAAATKEDLRSFMDQISTQIDGLYQADERWKDEIISRVDSKIHEVEHHLLVAMEALRSDVQAMYNDKLSQHEDRIGRLEKHAGFVAA